MYGMEEASAEGRCMEAAASSWVAARDRMAA
jgi:hypothetical protein